jgi:hypothetical protein
VALPRRSIVREEEFEEQLRALIPNAEDADDFTMAAESILAEEPHAGLPASRDGLTWYLPMQPVGGRRVSLFYAFDDLTVIFLFIVAHDD